MINFEEELKKFHPSIELEGVEESVRNHDMSDMADIFLAMMKEKADAATAARAEGQAQAQAQMEQMMMMSNPIM
ncbi:MAG: hypothetical protein K6E53_01905 [Lachnospiraceae bacterium]|jgi:hypothetical protein|nr:hypothetical protein [Lachnospiraceae bacterium]